MMEKIILLERLEIGYSSGGIVKSLLPPLSASAKEGELIALIGRNGVGKSTLLKTLAGIHSSLAGDISYKGNNIKEFSRRELAQMVGYISTETVRVENMTVMDLVALGRYSHTSWTGKIDTFNLTAIKDSIEKAGLSALKHRYITELSDGERQRAMIARILAQDSPVMLMDEPTAFLDLGSKYEIIHLMHKLSQLNNKTIIFSTHDLQIALTQSDKIWLILDDKLIEGGPEDLMITGVFDHLFDHSLVEFDLTNSTFLFANEINSTIYLEGTGVMRNLTEKAMRRVGFSISENITNPYIELPNEHKITWNLHYNSTIEKYDSLYNLVESLEVDRFTS